jgi:RNA polymerase sigma-70 factor, ECF subfamily
LLLPGAGENSSQHEAIADESIPTPQAVLEQSEQQALLKTAIDALAPKHRDILILRYYDELDYAETAERLGCSIGMVKSRLYYANQALKRKVRGEVVR